MDYSGYRTILAGRRGRILTLTLNRPEALNAVDRVMHAELARVFGDVAADEECDVVVLTGAGKAFSAGGDMDWMQEMIDDRAVFERTAVEAKQIVFSLLDLEKPAWRLAVSLVPPAMWPRSRSIGSTRVAWFEAIPHCWTVWQRR